MTYTPKEWQYGDTIAAEDLNHIEQGVANSSGTEPLIVNDNDGVLNKTWQEIYDAMPNTMFVFEEGKVLINRVGQNPITRDYMVEADGISYTTQTADGYPATNSSVGQ